MAGWTDSGSSRGRGGGGFANRGGANNNMNTRWRERRPAQLQQQHQHQQHHHQQQHQHQQQQHQQQQHQQHRYRPVNDNDQSSQQEHQHQHHPPVDELNRHPGQDFSASTRRPQPTRPPQARPTFADHKSPAPAANSSVNVNANEPDDKARRNAANFECNVCFDMADDPVVTKCGHLFCWECLYQWLHVHSHHRECPVCKGQVADDAIIPIYGRGGSAASVHAAPPRPAGTRVESSRQQQQQQAAMDWHMALDDEDVNPFDDLHRLFGDSLLRDAVFNVMSHDHYTDIEGYDDYYTNPYHHHGFDEVHHYDLPGYPAFATAGAGSSRGHGDYAVDSDDMIETLFDTTIHQEPDFVYRGGRRQHGRARSSRYVDRSFEMLAGSSSSAPYRDTGAGPHINNAGGSSRPNGGWTERRGRSNRNSNSGGGGGGSGRGMQNNSRRQGANYN